MTTPSTCTRSVTVLEQLQNMNTATIMLIHHQGRKRPCMFDLLVLEDLGDQYWVILRIDRAGREATDIGTCMSRDSSGNCCERVDMNTEMELPFTVTSDHLYGLLIGSGVENRLLSFESTSPGYNISSPTDYQLGATVRKEDLGGGPEQIHDRSFRFIVQPIESPGMLYMWPWTTGSSPLSVMSGVTEWSSLRYGLWAGNLLRESPWIRLVSPVAASRDWPATWERGMWLLVLVTSEVGFSLLGMWMLCWYNFEHNRQFKMSSIMRA